MLQSAPAVVTGASGIDPNIPTESERRRIRPESRDVRELCSDATLARGRLDRSMRVARAEGPARTIALTRHRGGFANRRGYPR